MGCSLQENKKAEKLFNQASSIFQKANSIESTQKAFKTKIRNGTINSSKVE